MKQILQVLGELSGRLETFTLGGIGGAGFGTIGGVSQAKTYNKILML